jgi:hypothetical protein
MLLAVEEELSVFRVSGADLPRNLRVCRYLARIGHVSTNFIRAYGKALVVRKVRHELPDTNAKDDRMSPR